MIGVAILVVASFCVLFFLIDHVHDHLIRIEDMLEDERPKSQKVASGWVDEEDMDSITDFFKDLDKKRNKKKKK